VGGGAPFVQGGGPGAADNDAVLGEDRGRHVEVAARLLASIDVTGDPIAVGVEVPTDTGPTALVDVKPTRLEVRRNVDLRVALEDPGIIRDHRKDEGNIGAVLFADDEQWIPAVFKFIVAGRQAYLPVTKCARIGFMDGEPPARPIRAPAAFDVAAARIIDLDGDLSGIVLSPERDPIQGGNAGPSDATACRGARQFGEDVVVRGRGGWTTMWSSWHRRGPGVSRVRTCFARQIESSKLLRKGQGPVAKGWSVVDE
jgi:hypothetical protein